MTSEIRKDYIQEKYVIIAPARNLRPHAEGVVSTKPVAGSCALCPDNIDQEEALYQYPTDGRWHIKVVPNKFPAVSVENVKAYGTQEVVVEVPEHGLHLEQLPEEHIARLLEVYADRTRTIVKDKKIKYLMIFKNAGGPAGASLAHAHSQIFATAFLPPQLQDKQQRMKRYRKETGRCVYCDVIKKERKSARLVYEDAFIIAFTPYASAHNYELWIMPRRHFDNVGLLSEDERYAFAGALKRGLKKIIAMALPYNFYFHEVVADVDQHFYMKIIPRSSIWAGVEMGSGLIINPISPEVAAEYYRQ